MKKVTFPGRQEVRATTIVVIAASILFGIYLSLADVIIRWGYSGIREWFQP